MTLTNQNPDCQSTRQREKLLAFSWLVVIAASGVLMPSPALAASAAAASFGDLICNIKNNGLSIYPRVLNVTAYIVGAFFALRSFLLLKKHGDNPAQSQVAPAVAHMFGSGALLAFPIFADTIQKTIFPKAAGGGTFACSAGSISGNAAGLDVMMENFVKNIYSPIFVLLSIISVAVGLTMIYQGLMRAAKTGTDPRAASPKDIIANLVFGAILISLATILPDTLSTIFGSPSISSMTNISIIKWSSLGGSGSTEEADKTVRAVLAFVQIIGGISFLRGWMIMKAAVEGGQAKITTAVTHIVAGAMAINIDKMLKILNSTFGVDVIV